MNALANDFVGDPRTDEVVERIETAVRRRHGGWVRDFRVTVKDEGLELRGRTHTYYAKQLAQHTAMQVGGLPILANRIEVL
jgi:osmotically-inducible protein OsmY